MSTDSARFLNIVPNTRICKKEKVEEDDDAILCKFCAKGFASIMALTNHARMEHFEEYSAGKQLAMEPPPKPLSKKEKAQQREETKKQIKRKTEELISTMSPTNLMSFASPDVSYVIIKDSSAEADNKEKTTKEKVKKAENIVVKDMKVSPIVGPFECLHPSNLVADGTCHQIFFSCCEYSQHYRDEHTRRRKGLRCQVCEKPLCADTDMPHCCETCGTGFKTMEELSAHVKTAHVKFKPYQCDVCLKRFTQQAGLQQHMRMHTGDRPYSCTFCPKAFTQKSGLEQHLRIHTKERPYRCVICSKSFCQSIHLKQHMRTHTNVSPFECGICQKRFKQSSHLTYHLKCHNPVNLTDEQKTKYNELLGLIGVGDVTEYQVLEVDNSKIEGMKEEYVFIDCTDLEEQ